MYMMYLCYRYPGFVMFVLTWISHVICTTHVLGRSTNVAEEPQEANMLMLKLEKVHCK